MTKFEQLHYIDNYIDDNLSKDELRMLVYDLISDESLRRSFKMFSQENYSMWNMKKSDQIKYIDQFLDGNMNK